MLKRAWLYITRKKLKTCIMFLILFGIGTLLFSGIAVKKAAGISTEKVNQRIGTSFSIRNNLQYNLGTSRGSGNVPSDMIKSIEELDGVTKCVRRMAGVARFKNAELVEKPEAYGPYGELMEEEYKNALVFYSTSDSAYDVLFQMESISLSDGRHLQEDDEYTSLVHEDFAKANGLELGDKLIFMPFEDDYDNYNPATEPIETEIVGFFTGENATQVSYASELNENIILTDLQTMCAIYGVEKENASYDYATFFTENPKVMERVMKSAMEGGGDWINYELLSNGQKFKALADSADLLNGLVDKLLIGTFIVGALIVALVLFLWIQGRIKETGIMMALGISKSSIIFQYITELFIIAIVSIVLSFFAGQAVAQSIGDIFVQQSSESAVDTATGGMGAMLGADAETHMLIKTVDDIEVNVEVSDMIIVFVLEMLVIVVAVLVSSIPVMRLKPREILAKID